MWSNHIRNYKISIEEANRYIKRAKAAIEELETPHTYSSRANAAAKRSSMDLSNSLVEIRR